MTLCIVWRTDTNICFASDSRLSWGASHADAGIKVSRVPFTIYSVGAPNQPAPVESSGDLGMAFAGSSSVALMTKEALSEVVRDIQGVPGYHDMGMDGLSDLLFRGFKVITRNIGAAIFGAAATIVVVAGYCSTKARLRAFMMKVDQNNIHSIREILMVPGEYEIFGSGATAARVLIPQNPNPRDFIDAIRAVIADPNVGDVGGNLQYGDFRGVNFQPVGIAELGQTAQGVHYWRGPLDLNGPDFNQADGLLPRFPYIDMI